LAGKTLEKALTDFGGKLLGRLERIESTTIEFERYKSTHKVAVCSLAYNSDVINRLNEGLIFAVPNFKSNELQKRYTLFELVDYSPVHFGASAVQADTLPEIRKEIFEKVKSEWFTESKVAYIRVRGNPVNYDLVVTDQDYWFEETWSYPLIGGEVMFLTKESMFRFINSSLPENSPVIGQLLSQEGVEVRLDVSKLVEHHFGVFAYTGGGKSNLVSHLVRTVLKTSPSCKVVIFDVAGEYTVNLADLMLSDQICGQLILDENISEAEQLMMRLTMPKSLSLQQNRLKRFSEILLLKNRVSCLKSFERVNLDSLERVTYNDVIQTIAEKIEYYTEKSVAGKIALQAILHKLHEFMRQKGLAAESSVGKELNEFVGSLNSGSWSQRGVQNLIDELSFVAQSVSVSSKKETPHESSEHEMIRSLNRESGPRLYVFSFTDVARLRRFTASVCQKVLHSRKSMFTRTPTLLFVFDEAQEVIPKDAREEDGTKFSSFAVEQLLRQGRKYGVGGAIATQRLAYLNTNVLQQLHTYFVGTLPRPYDRTTISDQFALDPAIVDRTLSLRAGEWLLSSYGATGVRNLPMFIRTPNNESVIIETLKSISA